MVGAKTKDGTQLAKQYNCTGSQKQQQNQQRPNLVADSCRAEQMEAIPALNGFQRVFREERLLYSQEKYIKCEKGTTKLSAVKSHIVLFSKQFN